MSALSESLKRISTKHTLAEIYLINSSAGISKLNVVYRDNYPANGNPAFVKKIRATIKEMEKTLKTKSEFRIRQPEFNVRLYR